VKAGATLCNWSRKTFKCTLAPPPSDPIFYILVALLTIVMSIPIIMLLQYILDEYASKKPRRMKKEVEVIPPEPSDSPAASPQTTSTAPQSDFGKLIIRGAVGENTAVSSTDTALLVYTGNICHSLCLRILLLDLIPSCHLICLLPSPPLPSTALPSPPPLRTQQAS
jgi:hypothetical protein